MKTATGEVLQTLQPLQADNPPAPKALGERTGKTQGQLEEGWNPKTGEYEYHHPAEWARMIELKGAPPQAVKTWLQDEREFPPLPDAPQPDPVVAPPDTGDP